MHEAMPTPERKKAVETKEGAGLENKEEKEHRDAAALFNKFADSFLLLGEPTMKYEQQNELLKESISFNSKAAVEKDPHKANEYKAKSEEYAEKYKESRSHKYAVGNYSPALITAELFLDATDKIPGKEKNKLFSEIQDIKNLIEKERPTGMTLEVVDKITQFIKKVQKYTK